MYCCCSTIQSYFDCLSFPYKNFGIFFCLSTRSNLFFLFSERYFPVVIGKLSWPNPFPICFSFNHNIPPLSTVSSSFFIRFSVYINHIYIVYYTAFLGFLISSFISLYSLKTLFTERNSSWVICESITDLEIKTSTVFNLLHTQTFNSTAELLMPTGTPTNEAKQEIETHPLIAETKKGKCSQ